MLEKIWSYIARKLAPYIAAELQIGGHCGICGKWVPNELVDRRYPWTLCEECKEVKD